MPIKLDPRPIAVITGASGGMGRACARLLGRRYQLALTDIREPQLSMEIGALEQDGYRVAARLAGDLADPTVAATLAGLTHSAGKFAALVHTAGLSPALAGWEAILRANLVATEHLLSAFEP